MQDYTRQGFDYLENEDYKNAKKCFDIAITDNSHDSEAYFGRMLCNFHYKNIDEMIKDFGSGFCDDVDFNKALVFADSEYKKTLDEMVIRAKESDYQLYSEMLASSDVHNVEVARDYFEILNYKDSNDLYKEAIKKLEKLTGIKENPKKDDNKSDTVKEINNEHKQEQFTSDGSSIKGLITVCSVYPMQTSLVDSVWGYPIIYSSYDGVEITWRNNSSKSIRYITFNFISLDKTGGIIKTAGNTTEAILKLIGPVESGRLVTSSSKGFWEHGLTNWIYINRIEIEYSDGSFNVYQIEGRHKNWNNFYDDIGIGKDIKTIKVGSSANSPCYVATCVYGSYDCPEVWTLRRYRDYCLSKKISGRIFINLYYLLSPTVVKIFGNNRWFKQMWKPVLDNMVKKLNAEGYSSAPYIDKEQKIR